jgi:diguanylate cyclase (GGDEF)-like protein
VGGRIWGVIAVSAAAGACLPDDCEERVERFADLVGTAIAGADARLRLIAEATTDPLTGLANRRAFSVHLDREWLRATRHARPLSVAVFDIDRFKQINDAAGHPVGDGVLAEVAARVAAALRSDGLVARFGGDEFVALLPECDAAGALRSAERVRQAVRAVPVGDFGTVTVSAGVTDVRDLTADLAVAATAEDLLRRADEALYQAKRLGRDSCCRAAPLLPVPRDPAGSR